MDDGDDLFRLAGARRLFRAITGVDPEERVEDADVAQDERDPVLIGTLVWQRREQYRARRDKRAYSVEGAIRSAYRGLWERTGRLTHLHSRQQDALGLQYSPNVVSIADMEAALSFVPNDRSHNKARWVYALVVGREPTMDGYREAEPRSVHEAARFLGIPTRDAEDGFGYAEATIAEFLCHEGRIE